MRSRGLLLVALLVAVWALSPGASAWDGDEGNPTHSTHTYMTDFALDALRATGEPSEALTYAEALVEGANQECHELVAGDDQREVARRYGVDIEQKRIEHGGTNDGCLRPEGWWQDALDSYLQGEKARAFFYLGVLLHMIQDMGAPAHANGVYHQAPSPGETMAFDNFELVALFNWKPKADLVDKEDPHLLPSEYYGFARQWTKEHAASYDQAARDTFGKHRHTLSGLLPASWKGSSDEERALVQRQQACSCAVTLWALQSALLEFAKLNQAEVTTPAEKPVPSFPPGTGL